MPYSVTSVVQSFGLFLAHFSFLFWTSPETRSGCFINLPWAASLGHSAPTGHTITHLPHQVQASEAAQGSWNPETTRELNPRFMTSQTWAPSTSSQTLTQRAHITQRLWSM